MTTAAFGGKGASAEAGAGAAGNEGNVVFRADADDGLNLRRRARQSDCTGSDTEGGEAVALVCLELGAIDDEIRVADRSAEVCQK